MGELHFLLRASRESTRDHLRTKLQEQEAIEDLVAQLQTLGQCTATQWSSRPTPKAVELVAVTDKSRDEIAVWLEPLVRTYGLTA
jgi:hypothetical protein